MSVPVLLGRVPCRKVGAGETVRVPSLGQFGAQPDSEARALDPVADDLASFALDILMDEAGYGRSGPNLLLVPGDA
jgi:hypothetical protein